jgi:hypothetical protein
MGHLPWEPEYTAGRTRHNGLFPRTVLSQRGSVEGVLLNELAARLDLVAHQPGEDLVGVGLIANFDDYFLRQVRTWRERLAIDIYANTPGLSPTELT